ncbi:phage virion morphogenesis protein [Komagataeibacter xylinus]|uniref:phage virion morphogenesis protein n=1 Tax=Komagataeibacter xylinus TaxID=28448 RepID=UPI00280A7252|nr:phage virion morphogenesis protein [Komagataeibacter xylinus]
MSSMFSIEFDSERMQGALSAIAAIGRRPGPILAAVADGMVDLVRDRFRNGEDPQGVKWDSYAPLNPLYAQDKEGPSILIGRGGFSYGLASSIRGGATDQEAWVGSDLKYAGVHQSGATIVPREAGQLSFMMGGRLWHLASVKIPARPYLGFGPKERDLVVGELEAFLARAMRG